MTAPTPDSAAERARDLLHSIVVCSVKPIANPDEEIHGYTTARERIAAALRAADAGARRVAPSPGRAEPQEPQP